MVRRYIIPLQTLKPLATLCLRTHLTVNPRVFHRDYSLITIHTIHTKSMTFKQVSRVKLAVLSGLCQSGRIPEQRLRRFEKGMYMAQLGFTGRLGSKYRLRKNETRNAVLYIYENPSIKGTKRNAQNNGTLLRIKLAPIPPKLTVSCSSRIHGPTMCRPKFQAIRVDPLPRRRYLQEVVPSIRVLPNRNQNL